ncbi:ParB N-terminal domain-containing protein [Streptomyces sp. PsTaAH-124]|uniref:ParB N-terminal domain-containing protein n=1 Tax=Streptomyces sp. PsTaAH-124 TaxID=1157638 RepID=UPI000996C037
MDYYEDQLETWKASRRRLLPLSRFNDDDIRPIDYSSWRATEQAHTHYRVLPELEELQHQVEIKGLQKPVEIWASVDGSSPVVSDGHHRITVLKRLGWTHVPYRWYHYHPNTRKRSYQRRHLP